jgi:hypothetical protein
MNLTERFELFTLSPRCVGEFNQKLDEFFEKITSMPPSKMAMAEAKSRV